MEDGVTLRKKLDKKGSQGRILKARHRSRNDSLGAIEEMVQCGICLDKLTDSRMLPCQHTFCLKCLQSNLAAKLFMNSSNQNQSTIIKCPICKQKFCFDKGLKSLDDLPRNLYIENLLKLVDGNISPGASKNCDFGCFKCQIVSESLQCCPHCMKVYCKVCWNEHLSDLEANISNLLKQIKDSQVRLDCKFENFDSRCDHLQEKLRKAVENKIAEIRLMESRAQSELKGLKNEKKIAYDNISNEINKIREKLENDRFKSENTKASAFMGLHRETSHVIQEVSHFGEARIILDPESLKFEQDTEGIYKDLDEPETLNNFKVTNPIESVEIMVQQYRNRSYKPRLIWNKCPRPAHVGISPWNDSLLYIAASDTHSVLIFNKETVKLEGRLTSPDMLYPISLAFSIDKMEIYVSDKWAHCIHVFSDSGDYLRKLCSKGNGNGRLCSPDGLALSSTGELVVSDSGNDRIVVLNPDDGTTNHIIGFVHHQTRLNMPTGLAIFEDNVIVADTGNHRIKIFNFSTGELLQEFGALGRDRGQFRSAEVVAVDSMGFILVGDGGNARVQVFRPDGTLVKVFGVEGCKWVSGICVSKEMDIITTDSKSRCLRIF